MIGSIDCMHWEWKNCPTAWKGQYTRGSGKPTIVLEAVALQDLWIWQAFFGPPGTLNDINVLDRSPVFDDILQEATRKDVERAFGVLQARFAIVKNPAILWDKRQIGMVMRTCIILHNMIVENERNGYTQYDTSEFEEGDSSRSSQVDMSYSPKPSNLCTMLNIRSRLRIPMVGNTIGVALRALVTSSPVEMAVNQTPKVDMGILPGPEDPNRNRPENTGSA
uniref:DDE Tnp4 domain-containing protein n=1 Tax=Brassica oleracea var. oleracea TaxID=109376 RepID=A0A0D3CXB4_BRAOL